MTAPFTPRLTPRPDGQPPLGRWGHAWRIGVSAVGGVVFLLVTRGVLPDPAPAWVAPLVLLDIVLLGPVALVLLAFHRRYPLPVALAVTALTAVSSLAGVAGLVCLVSIAARRRTGEICAVAGLAVATGILYELLYPMSDGTPLWILMVFVVLVVGIAVGWGMYLGARRELLHSLRLRADAAEREQALQVAQAQAQERARIAREMHDELAHRISLLSMHAGALAFRDDLPADQVRAEARVIQAIANDALDELRAVLGMLRHPRAEAGVEQPQPSLAQLDALVDEARSAGPVRVENELGGQSPAAWLGRQAYRVVQECLTNARKHAPGAAVSVRLAGRPGGALDVEVRNDTPSRRDAGAEAIAGSGLGLVGLAERAALAGGTLEHGPTADGGYAVRVRLPWTAQEVR